MLLWPAAAAAEIVLFSQRDFQGARYGLEQPSSSMAFSPRSVRVASGTRWELCPRPFFGGACIMIERNDPSLSLPRAFSGVVRSAREAKAPDSEPPREDKPDSVR